MPTTPIDLTALAVGARVQDTFLVWEVETRSQGDGSRFVILTLANASGRLRTAPFWSSELHKVEGLARGAIVRATGDVSEYRGDRQLKVTAIDPVPPGGADLTRLVPSVEGGVAKYWTTLDKWRAEILVDIDSKCFERGDVKHAAAVLFVRNGLEHQPVQGAQTWRPGPHVSSRTLPNPSAAIS